MARRRRPVVLRGATALVLVLALAVGAAGCGSDRVSLVFRPPVGRTFRYATTVTTSTTTEIADQAPETTTEQATLDSEQQVLEAHDDRTDVQIVIRRPGAADRTYVASFDRAAQLTGVERVEGIPSQALGDLGLSEIFPAAAGAPPAQGLRPGDTWDVRETTSLPGTGGPVPLEGHGRLVELGVVDGRPTAHVHSTTTFPLSVPGGPGTPSLSGTQTTELDATYDTRDGSIVDGTAVTTGRFAVQLEPPAGRTGPPATGTVQVEVSTTILRR